VYDSNVRAEFLENYRYSHDYWSPYVKNAEVYTRAAAGSTWSNSELKQLQMDGREPLEFNIMRRPLSFFSGWLRDNVNSVVYSPVEGSDSKTADQFTKLSYYIWDKGQGFPVFLDAYDEAFKSGISLVGLQMDYSKDFLNGDISFYKRTYNSFYLDPTFTSIDLKDCSFAITRDLINKEYSKQLLPFVDSKHIDEINMSIRDDKFMSYHPQFSTISRNKNLLAYDQYYKRVTKKRKFLVDLESAFYRDITDLPDDEVEKLEMGISRMRETRNESEALELDTSDIPNVEIQEVDRPFVELCIFLNGEEVYKGDDKTGINDTFPFVPCMCYMEPSIWDPSIRIQGMAASNYSAQRQFNKRHMKIIDMMDSTISTGYKYIIGSVPDPEDLQQTGSNRLIGVDGNRDNAPEGLNSVQELQGGGANPALMEYQQVLDNLTLTLGNVTEATMGMDEHSNTLVSGRLAQVKIAQNLQSNRKIFDNVDTSQQVLGGLLLTAIQKNYPVGKVKRILNEEPTPQFYEDQFEQYDAVIKEGVRSRSQKDAYYYELVNLKKDGIVDVPQGEIIRALGMSGISDLEEAIQAQQEQQAEQQKKVDAQEQMALELANSQKEANLALAQVRRGREVGELGLMEYRASEAQQNIAEAALTRAKTITEIASMEDDRIIKVMAFVNELEQHERDMQNEISNKTQAISNQINSETEGTAENTQLKQAQQEIQQEVSNENEIRI
jgi:hypothetical protein